MNPSRILPLLVVLMVSAGVPARAQDKPAPGDLAPVARVLTLEVAVPDGAWTLQFDEVWRMQGELWVFARVSRPEDALAAQMITRLRAEVAVRLPPLPMKYFVLGKTWEWKNQEEVEWITERSDAYRNRRRGERLWRRR